MACSLAAVPAFRAAGSSHTAGVRALTRWGEVRGARLAGINVFKGIRYGAPTGGSGRFRPPMHPKPWVHPVDALSYGPACPQSDPSSASASRFEEGESEDCLTLNVWTPGLRDKGKRPVMVWLHGGGLGWLSASGEWQAGHNISRRGNVVMVSPNHRIGVFGFAHIAGLDPAFAGSSQVGMLDLVMALEWVRDNIEEFGGDPDNVTIMGQSGGGQKVSLLMAMPAAEGLFHKAIIQSGPMPLSLEPPYATALTRRLLDKLKLPVADIWKIQSLSPKEILGAYYPLFHEIGGFGIMGIVQDFAPVVDGASLPQQPFWHGAPPASAKVPLLIGCTRTEMTEYTLANDPTAFRIDFSQIEAKLRPIFADDSAQILAGYRSRHADASPWEIYSLILSDWPTRLFSLRIADAKARQGSAPTFVYRMDWKTAARGGVLMSPHAVDIQFVLDNVDVPQVDAGQEEGKEIEARRRMTDQMSGAWIAFARTGNPGHALLPQWNAYDAVRRPTMLFNLESRLADNPDGADIEELSRNLDRYRIVAGGVS
ncbi:MAG: carboxylesterase family protein [Novosphingobium sp.]